MKTLVLTIMLFVTKKISCGLNRERKSRIVTSYAFTMRFVYDFEMIRGIAFWKVFDLLILGKNEQKLILCFF